MCGKTLLDLVARGSAILAEMQRLSHHIPKMFASPGSRYSKIIYDYSYFSDPNKYENEIQKSDVTVSPLRTWSSSTSTSRRPTCPCWRSSTASSTVRTP